MLRLVCIVFASMSLNMKYTKAVDMFKYSCKHKGRKIILDEENESHKMFLDCSNFFIYFIFHQLSTLFLPKFSLV